VNQHLVFLLEEPSAKDLLQGLLPKLLPGVVFVHYLVFEGKQDLERQLVRKLRGWKMPNSSFVVLRDQDAAECVVVKAKLKQLAIEAGREETLVRIACRELEAWVVGDWRAVGEAFGRPELHAQALKEVHRAPDRLVRPVEALRKFVPQYQKRDGARRVGPLLDPARNQSDSFRSFCTGVQRLVMDAGKA
jgi:hypothetical protein